MITHCRLPGCGSTSAHFLVLCISRGNTSPSAVVGVDAVKSNLRCFNATIGANRKATDSERCGVGPSVCHLQRVQITRGPRFHPRAGNCVTKKRDGAHRSLPYPSQQHQPRWFRLLLLLPLPLLQPALMQPVVTAVVVAGVAQREALRVVRSHRCHCRPHRRGGFGYWHFPRHPYVLQRFWQF